MSPVIIRERGAGTSGDGSESAAGGANAAAAGRSSNRGCGVAGAAKWLLMVLSYVRSVSAKAAKCLEAL